MNEYTKEVPTKEGWYWLYGKRSGAWIEHLYICDPDVLCLNIINYYSEEQSVTLKSYLKQYDNDVEWFCGPLPEPDKPE